MPRAANVCPRCGASVTPYAAGCGVCGADLEHLRRNRRSVLPTSRPLPALPAGAGQNVVLTVLLLAVALFAPLYGLLVAGLVGFDRNRRGERTMRNMAVAAGALALLAFFLPLSPLGQLGPVSS